MHRGSPPLGMILGSVLLAVGLAAAIAERRTFHRARQPAVTPRDLTRGSDMTILIVLLVAAAVFGIGAVLEGLAWLAVVSLVLLIAAAIGLFRFFGGGRSRTTRA